LPKVAQNPWTFLADNRQPILKAWIETQMANSRIHGDRLTKEEVTEQSRELLDALIGTGVPKVVEDIEASEYEPIRKLLSDISTRRESMGLPAGSTASSVMSLKMSCVPYLLPLISEDMEQVQAFARVVDALSLFTYEALLERREAMIGRQAQEILEISTPVIKVWNGVVAAPLIGTLDSERTQRFMERLLERIVETNSPVALVDITGVPTVDTQTAQHLIDTVSAVRLLGSQVILTGVRPSIAQTLVHLGVNLGDITTRSSFAAGFRVALEMLHLELPSRPGRA
jgi:rsbT co-antagonist protein RsbR